MCGWQFREIERDLHNFERGAITLLFQRLERDQSAGFNGQSNTTCVTLSAGFGAAV